MTDQPSRTIVLALSDTATGERLTLSSGVGVHIDDHVRAFRAFLLALQFHPDNIKEVIPDPDS